MGFTIIKIANSRYFINQYIDHETQNSYNLMTGKFQPMENLDYRIKKGESVLQNILMFSALPLIILFIMMFTNNNVSPSVFFLFVALFVGLVYSYLSGKLKIF